MATVVRVRKLVNPRARKARGKRKSNPKHRRRLSLAQIRAGFGGKRRQGAMKAARKRKRTGSSHSHARRSNPPRPRVRVVTKVKTRWRTRKRATRAKAHRKRSRTRHANPAGLLVTYGPALNPKKRRKAVAKRKRRSKSNPHRRHAHRSHTRVVTKYRYRTRRRKSNPHRRRRRNPSALMHGGMKNMAVAVGGGLVGVTLTKTIPGMLPAQFLSSGLMRVAVSAAVAWGSGELASRMVGAEFGKYVFFGGLMQAGSVALNAFLPTVGGVIGLAGLTPSNDIMLPYNMFSGRGAMVPAGSAGSMRAGAGFAPAFA